MKANLTHMQSWTLQPKQVKQICLKSKDVSVTSTSAELTGAFINIIQTIQSKITYFFSSLKYWFQFMVSLKLSWFISWKNILAVILFWIKLLIGDLSWSLCCCTHHFLQALNSVLFYVEKQHQCWHIYQVLDTYYTGII